jgi:hypothetical protein
MLDVLEETRNFIAIHVMHAHFFIEAIEDSIRSVSQTNLESQHGAIFLLDRMYRDMLFIQSDTPRCYA